MSLNFGQNLFPPRGEYTIGFTFADFITGQGYATFYIGTAKDSSAADEKLTFPKVFKTSTSSTAATRTTGEAIATFTKIEEFDFDSEMGISSILKGRLVSEIRFGLDGDHGSSNLGYLYVVLNVKHVRGATVTSLGTARTNTISHNDDAAMTTAETSLTIDISRTHFQVGDILRLTTELWVQKEAAAAPTAGRGKVARVYHDPENDQNKFIVQIPFKVTT